MAAGKSPTSKVASAHEDLEEDPLDLPPLSDVDTAEEGDPPMAVWLEEDKPELTPGSAEDLQIKMEIEEPGAGAASLDTPGRQSFQLRGCQVIVEVLESEKERSEEAEVFGRPKEPSQMCKEEELFSCPYCRASFAGEPFLEEHLKTRHPKTTGSGPVLPLGPATQELCDSSSSCSSSSWSDAQSDWRRWKMLMRSRDKRKPNFTENEVDIIIAEVKKNAKVLFNREKQWNMRDKMKVWQDIAIKVSALGQSRRSRKEVKKKWYDLKRNPREGLAEWLRAQGWGSEKVREPPVERSVASSAEPALAEGASVAEGASRPEEEGHDEPSVPTEEQESDHPEQEICSAPESLLPHEDAQSPVTDSAPSDLSHSTSGLLAIVEQLLKAQQETNAKLDSLTKTVRCGFADFSGVGHNGLAGSVGSMERSVVKVSRCLAQIERKMDVWAEKMSQAQAEQMKVIENVTATLNLVATQLALVAPSRVSPCPTKPQKSPSELES
ncbi:uncharacterized protein LOC114664296 isoform X2 [Erpetoichthys calabaricus]|uniref:uncharacterized protein LOC114664296 isoform X2 n=1 Tax=Erpetoichthys calabaricus TaxID=27687 RepID=UPI002234A87E|nr:uncharacterized protein LOC114664296 isoform X2 [Erpetoichthys calabaricus]